ncbi:iron-sulfur cluster assembly scaffold protein [Sphingomonas ginkgonis]|uniref:Iron-sulfur cluster assembly scaffold protein n=1 Tax=Sphingomonas ginkgonis TaxID=2315330 RepID=A0A429VCX6_9SPHN|nr:iron-sulfur cluster assembly scaffold protein [Sphingomonas ginkgonis]RST31859.1 iron-sulfur cluster assembly scaffold protein [Sphingomonas ginkgonis]
MSSPLYTIDILRLATSAPQPSVADPHGRGERRSPTCGSRIVAAVRLAADGTVEALSQEVQACAFGQASATLVARHAAGRSGAEIRGARSRVADWLAGRGEAGWPEFELLAPVVGKPARHAAVLLPFDALIAALEAAELSRSDAPTPR